MIKNIVVLVVLIYSIGIHTQTDFQGQINYNFKLHDKTGEMTDEEANEFMGTQQTYYIKAGKYKTQTNGLFSVTQYYPGKDKLYTQMEGVKSLMYNDTSNRSEEILAVNIKENALKILNYTCNLLEIKTKQGVLLYYYNEAIKVNAEDFKNHKYGLWYYCLQKTKGALPLKMISDISDVKISIEASSVKKQKLEDVIFNIPLGIPIVRNPDN